MPVLSAKQVRALTGEQRVQRMLELRAELSKMRTMSSAGGALENPSRIRELRKAIARILTIENETAMSRRDGE
jgi:large subunit ribosomal protein L29